MNAGLRVVGQHDIPEMAATALHLCCNYCDFKWQTLITDRMMFQARDRGDIRDAISMQLDNEWADHVLKGMCHKQPDPFGKALSKSYPGALFGPDPAWEQSRPVDPPPEPEPKKEEKKRPARLIVIED